MSAVGVVAVQALMYALARRVGVVLLATSTDARTIAQDMVIAWDL